MSDLLLGIVLSVCTCWFHNMVTLSPWLVSTDFGACSYQYFLSSCTPFPCIYWSVVVHTLYHVFLCTVLLPVIGMLILCGLLSHQIFSKVCTCYLSVCSIFLSHNILFVAPALIIIIIITTIWCGKTLALLGKLLLQRNMFCLNLIRFHNYWFMAMSWGCWDSTWFALCCNLRWLVLYLCCMLLIICVCLFSFSHWPFGCPLSSLINKNLTIIIDIAVHLQTYLPRLCYVCTLGTRFSHGSCVPCNTMRN